MPARHVMLLLVLGGGVGFYALLAEMPEGSARASRRDADGGPWRMSWLWTRSPQVIDRHLRHRPDELLDFGQVLFALAVVESDHVTREEGLGGFLGKGASCARAHAGDQHEGEDREQTQGRHPLAPSHVILPARRLRPCANGG